MTKRKRFLLVFTLIFSFLLVLGTAVAGQEEVPPPYAGMENPFPWDDAAVQEAGKTVYQGSCLGCHGIDGGNLASADFSTEEYRNALEERPDHAFWILSEGETGKGMPPFKSSLSEEQRWQILTYLWSLGAAAPPVSPPPPPTVVEGGKLHLSAPEQAQAGQPLTLNAQLRNEDEGVIAGGLVKFFINVDFFASGPMEIGEALTDNNGIATLEYTPRIAGETKVVARYGTIEATSSLNISEREEPFYEAEAGIRLPAPGDPVFIGPESALQLGEMGQAPTSAFYLPGGVISWLLIVAVTVMVIWVTYFRVVYQVFRIPMANEVSEINPKLVPMAIMAFVTVMGVILVLMLLTGPYSHFHLLQ
ncbi:MAG: c-type cytochrome [Dehalococcoidales bacterium]|nr:c-type cytochrome [Dehalococcoidales bacterium]